MLRPERLASNQMKVKTEEKVIENPKEIAESFNAFFKKKVDDLAEGIKKKRPSDTLEPLKNKHKNSKIAFSFNTVTVAKIIRKLKQKTSCGFDEISAEILKLGKKVVAGPLTCIINASILTGKFPTKMKEAKVCPLYKKGDRKKLKNYRPVALLSVPGMVLEKVMALQIEKYFEKNKFFQPFQFGFRKNKSTISELLTLFDRLLQAKEDKKEIALVLYDLSAAFDTIDPEILCEKLKIYGLDTLAMTWMKSYLKDRTQRVIVSGELSSSIKINRGAPQGSRLSPLLFLILMADLNLHIDKSFCLILRMTPSP